MKPFRNLRHKISHAVSTITRGFKALHHKPSATLKAIFIASAAGQPMQAISSVYADRNLGLERDRYHDNTGHWKFTDGCQVTLITEHELKHAQKRTDIVLDGGAHRRNLVIDGIKPKALAGKSFKIGQAVLEYQKPRPPCAYIDQVEGPGIGRALRHNSGVCLRVIESGTFSIGDPVIIL